MANDWQPIETAPKDGEWVLLFSPDSIEPQSFVGQWRDDDNPWGGSWWSDYPDAAYPIDSDPSHWMPLPPSPNQAE